MRYQGVPMHPEIVYRTGRAPTVPRGVRWRRLRRELFGVFGQALLAGLLVVALTVALVGLRSAL